MQIHAGSCLRRPRRHLRAAVGVCAGILGLAPLARAQTPMGTAVPNVATARFIDTQGRPQTTTSLPAIVTVGQLAGVSLAPPREDTTIPGTTVVLGHILTNTGNGPDALRLTARDALGRAIHLYADVNGDGLLDGGDTAITAPLPLTMGQSAHLLLVVVVPLGRAQRGTVDAAEVVATSTVDGATADSLTDRIVVRDAGVVVTLSKTVDLATATTGDTLTYSFTYAAAGTNTAAQALLIDSLPAGLTFVPGSVRVRGLVPGGSDTASFDAAHRILRVPLGDLAAGSNGTAQFRAVMGAQTRVANVALAAYGTPLGSDTATSNGAGTDLVLPDVHVEKTLVGRSTAQVGDTLSYRIRVENRSATVPVRDLLVIDTLPDGLALVQATPAAVVDGQVVRWSLPGLGTAVDAQFALTVRVTHNTVDTVRLVNVATAAGSNAAAVSASASALTVVNLGDAAVTLEKSAGALEAGLGETAPFSLTVRNTGSVRLTDIRIHDRLPAELRLARGSVVNADSAVTADSGVTFYVAGPVAPGARVVVHYAAVVVAGSRDLLLNTAVATAFGEAIHSADAMAFVRVRRGSPMETRAVIGKVWIDANADGVQQAGEPGVAGVDVWTQDGDVATTDADGRFSFRNLATGRQSFRLDASTIPADLRVADGAESDLEVRDGDGWTTPRVAFRLLPRAGRVASVWAPLPWRLTARTVHAVRPDTTVTDTVPCPATLPAAPGLPSAPVILRGVNFVSARAVLLPSSRASLDRTVAYLRRFPDARVEIEGHTDSVGSHSRNLRLSVARAQAVVDYLVRHGIPASHLSAAGFGSDRPLGSNRTAVGRARNRRVELRFIEAVPEQAAAPHAAPREAPRCTATRVVRDTVPPLAEYVVRIENPYDAELAGVSVRFADPVDSVAVSIADTVRRVGRDAAVELPTLAPHGRALVTGWTRRPADSAAVQVTLANGESELVTARVAAQPAPVAGRRLQVALDSLPVAAALGADAAVDLVVEPPATGNDVTLALPAGWRVVAPADSGGAQEGATDQQSFARAAAPTPTRDRSGREVLLWHTAGPQTSLLVRVEPVRAAERHDSLRIAPLRTAGEREAERGRALLAGPGVAIFAPADGAVLATDRLYIGVRGEAGRPVTLFDGDSVLAESQLRPDGVRDFVNLRLTAGPHRLRARMLNSWGQERWDSTAVHVSGRPATLRLQDSALTLVADGHTVLAARGEVLDRWDVPVATRPFVTVSAAGATPEGADADPSSVGLQVRADERGGFVVALRAGRDIGAGRLQLRADSATATFPLEVLPPIRPLMVTGVGRLGLGASPEDFGAVTARGRLDARTAILLTYDTRRLDAGRDAFDRTADPLEAAQYPILGDASQVRTLGASRTAFSARIERGFDWIAAGDILSEGFDRDLGLADYRRALNGVAGRVTTGALVWHAFGSQTSQTLRQTQLRGDGTSGPYQLDRSMRQGAERVTVETRALDNPTRVLARQALVRDVDYQVDYLSGMLLLKRPLPATDIYGNPLFLVVTFEAEGGGPSSTVWGLRTSLDALRLVGRRGAADSVRIGATYIHDGAEAGGYSLSGVDARVLRGWVDLRAELAASRGADSSGTAVSVGGTVRPARGMELGLRWSSIGDGFRNPSNVALRPGTRELGLTARLRTPVADLRLEHEHQWFGLDGVSRQQTRGTASRTLFAHLTLEASAVDDRAVSGTTATASQAGEVKLAWRPRSALELWADGRHQFGEAQASKPDYAGAGARVRLWQGMSLEAVHRRVFLPGGSDYSVTDLGLRSQLLPGTEAYGSWQLAGVSGAQNAALVGLSSRLHLGAAWALSGMFERRAGLHAADPLDPVRALPFLQQEEDYWSAAAGLEFAPAHAPFRAAARGEYRDGSLLSTRLLTASGDVSASRSLALLSRQELMRTSQRLTTGLQESRRLWSLWGLAFRPTASDRLNALVKLEWLDAHNPAGGGILTNQGHEGRLIGAAEGIWAPARDLEVGLRVAERRTRATLVGDDSTTQTLSARAAFLGARVQLGTDRRVGVRAEGRLLIDHLSASRRWDVAPQLVVAPITGIEIAAGWRFGDLHDPDFAVSGGNGFFLTFGVRFTERSAASAAAFWRERLTAR